MNLSREGVLTVTFSRPGGNAMSAELFKEWLSAIQYAATNESVKVLVQTGAGKFYSSGKDLGPTMHATYAQEVEDEMDVIESLINALINFPKPCIAAVNGPSIGLAVTSLALFDFVYAVPEATFTVPFMRWGFCAEGCSSVLFPRLMGRHIANDLLLGGTTFKSERLASVGFLEVLPKDDFLSKVLDRAKVLATYDESIVEVTKNLVNKGQRKELMVVNHGEIATLKVLMLKEKGRRAIQEFVDQRAAKQKKRANL